MTSMEAPNRSLLAVAISEQLFAQIDEMLRAKGFFAESVVAGHAGLELAVQLPYDAIISTLPLPDMTALDFLAAVRRPNSASRGAALVLVASDKAFGEAAALVGKGVNRVVRDSEVESTLAHELFGLLEVHPRIDIRTITRLKVQLGWGASSTLCQTVNLSASGMLIRTDQEYPYGTKLSFELTLPGESYPVRGEAVVVRHAEGYREKISGLGVRFALFARGDESRLANWLAERHR
jgi:CheY-like chemotaxis protein